MINLLKINTLWLKNEHLLEEYSPTKKLADEKFIAEAVWECLKNNDPEGVVEVIQYHLETVNKLKAAKNIKLPRSTLYKALKSKNPNTAKRPLANSLLKGHHDH